MRRAPWNARGTNGITTAEHGRERKSEAAHCASQLACHI